MILMINAKWNIDLRMINSWAMKNSWSRLRRHLHAKVKSLTILDVQRFSALPKILKRAATNQVVTATGVHPSSSPVRCSWTHQVSQHPCSDAHQRSAFAHGRAHRLHLKRRHRRNASKWNEKKIKRCLLDVFEGSHSLNYQDLEWCVCETCLTIHFQYLSISSTKCLMSPRHTAHLLFLWIWLSVLGCNARIFPTNSFWTHRSSMKWDPIGTEASWRKKWCFWKIFALT